MKSSAWAAWLYAAPALLLVGLVSAVPIAQTAWWSSHWRYAPLDARLWIVLKNSLSFTLSSVVVELVLGLGFALLLARPFRGRGAARAAVLLPWALPTAVMALAWRWIFNAESGVLGDLLFRFGLADSPRIAWLASPGLAMFACVLADVWKTTPFVAILLMSGLAQIPGELYEAAEIDGAGPIRRFFMITLPLLRPALALAATFRVIHAFGIFDLIWVLTGGGPGGRTQTIALYVYDTVFRYQEWGYGCALAMIMAACLTVFAGGTYWVLRPAR